MGYITNFKLKVYDKDWDGDKSRKADKTYEFKDLCLVKDNWGDYISSAIDGMEAKWYEYDTDMRSLSRVYPNYLFELTGDGEESEDNWKAYYLNGKSQVEQGILFYPPFDKEKLK